jgi:hypothetical protein
VMLYLPEDGPQISRGDMALVKMGLLDKPKENGVQPSK